MRKCEWLVFSSGHRLIWWRGMRCRFARTQCFTGP